MIPPLVTYAQLAAAAYLMDVNPSALGPAVAAQGYDVTSRVAVDGFSAFVAENAQDVVVVYQGSSNPREFLADAEILVARLTTSRLGNPYLVHSGFLRAWMDLWAWRMAVNTRGKRVKVIGHSLGADIATLDAAVLPVDEIWTYGSAKCGLAGFVTAFNALPILSVRVVHDRDLVPTVPALPYDHVKGLLQLTKDGLPSEPKPAGLFQRAEQILADFDGEAIEDHSIATYISACALYTQAKVTA